MMHPYRRQGILAIDPRAFFELYLEQRNIENATVGNVAIVSIRGPLDNEPGGWCDSYEAITARVAAACTSAAAAVVLKIDSPGGDVAGCFDAARAIRATATASGKPLVAYVSGCACSAGYALAAAAPEVVVAEAGIVGSIGILNSRIDVTAADAAMGLRYALITSGAHKADGNPHAPITDAELAEQQLLINSLAGTFYQLIYELRGVDQDKLAAMQARLFHGNAAVTAGLADRVQSFDALLATLSEGNPIAGEPQMTTFESIRASLAEIADGEDEDAKTTARRMLAAMDGPGEEETPEEEGDEEKEEEGGEEASAQAAPAAAAVSAQSAGALAQTVQRLSAQVAELVTKNESADRTSFLASRPDLSKELLDVLNGKPIAEVRAIVNAIPQQGPLAARATSQTAQGTRGKGQVGSGEPGRPVPQGDYAEAMLTAFGRTTPKQPVRMEGRAQIFETMTPEQARKRYAELTGKAPS